MTDSSHKWAHRLSGKVALVTGASAGIGLAIAKRLAEEGAAVALGARRGQVIADHVTKMAEAGHRALAVPLDVKDKASLSAAVEAISDEFGRLDVVVANAGMELVKPFTALTDKDWTEVLQVNLVGAARTVRAAMPLLARDGGSVVMISSVSGLHGATALSAYAAAKGGVVALGRSLAKELSPRRIRVNIVAPAMVDTDMFERITSNWTPEQVEAMRQAHPLGFGDAEDVAAAVAYLACSDAKWVTGSVLIVDGGLSIA